MSAVLDTAGATARDRVGAGADQRPTWAWAGALAGLAGIAMILLSGGLAVTEGAMADNARIVDEIIDKEGVVWAFQAVCSLGALGATVFAAGLRRRLAVQAPADSLLPSLAAAGMAAVAIMLLVGGGISTELFWSLTRTAEEIDPDTVGANLGIFNTMAWVWAGAGLTAGAVAVASLRHGSLPRWIGWVSAIAAGLVLLVQLLPVQYMAAFVGAPWLLVVGLGLARAERST